MTMKVNGTTGLTFPDTTTLASAGQSSVQAWVNFNGTGTVAIRASYNVTSITDNGTGDYTVNFTNALVDADYAAVVTADTTSTVNRSVAIWSGTNQTASLVRIGTLATGGSAFDASYVSVAIFR
jgi:hypothetical protein